MSECCNEVVVNQVSQAIVVETSAPYWVNTETTSTATVSNLLSEVEVSNTQPLPSQVLVSQVGVQGIPGPPGTGGYSEAIAGENISIYQIIVSGSDGKAYIADPTNINDLGLVLGVAISSATTNTTVQYVSTGTINGGSWSLGAKYFLGLNGLLTTSPISLGSTWLQFMGVGKTSSTFNITLGNPIRIG